MNWTNKEAQTISNSNSYSNNRKDCIWWASVVSVMCLSHFSVQFTLFVRWSFLQLKLCFGQANVINFSKLLKHPRFLSYLLLLSYSFSGCKSVYCLYSLHYINMFSQFASIIIGCKWNIKGFAYAKFTFSYITTKCLSKESVFFFQNRKKVRFDLKQNCIKFFHFKNNREKEPEMCKNWCSSLWDKNAEQNVSIQLSDYISTLSRINWT